MGSWSVRRGSRGSAKRVNLYIELCLSILIVGEKTCIKEWENGWETGRLAVEWKGQSGGDCFYK